MSDKCIVHGCLNHKHQGTFIGDLCMPCHNMLTSGEVKYGETFVHGLRDCIEELEDKIAKAVKALEFIDGKISWEINPSNYYDDEVCDMNEDWCEIGNYAEATLAEIKGENDDH